MTHCPLQVINTIKPRPEYDVLRRRVLNDTPAKAALETRQTRPANLINAAQVIARISAVMRLLDYTPMQQVRGHNLAVTPR